MTPDAADVTVDELAAAMRNHADGTPAHEAAVELLIVGARGHWLRRSIVRRHIDLTRDGDTTDPGPWFAAIDWAAIGAEIQRGQPDTTAELIVLRVAGELADGLLGDGLTSCDRDNVQAIADAVLHAGQARR